MSNFRCCEVKHPTRLVALETKTAECEGSFSESWTPCGSGTCGTALAWPNAIFCRPGSSKIKADEAIPTFVGFPFPLSQIIPQTHPQIRNESTTSFLTPEADNTRFFSRYSSPTTKMGNVRLPSLSSSRWRNDNLQLTNSQNRVPKQHPSAIARTKM